MSRDDSQLRGITRDELRSHSKEDPWIAIGGRVYAVKEYLKEHPGGVAVLMEKAGLDATEDFKQIGHGKSARELMKSYCIGRLEGETLLPEEDLAGKGRCLCM
eukprot:TRINITY_DN1055_c3_g1_i3.p1 TRINITY_DN1055_c3_g1~~TRINITY_DN1055_c3_g1_i3.p1  ORF type:complete len:119 (+),score=17.02 TRINITY_DN1055_c3_g1_i3:51-359(+)